MENKVKRDDGMKAFMVNPATYDSQAEKAKGFELDGPSKEAAAEAADPKEEAQEKKCRFERSCRSSIICFTR